MKKLIIFLSFLVIFTGCGKEEEIFETNKTNLNEGVIEDKIIGDFQITNTSIIYEKGVSTFKTELSCTDSTYVKAIKIILKSKSGYVLEELTSYLNQTVKDKVNIVIASDIDLTNAYSVEYVFE